MIDMREHERGKMSCVDTALPRRSPALASSYLFSGDFGVDGWGRYHGVLEGFEEGVFFFWDSQFRLCTSLIKQNRPDFGQRELMKKFP